MTFQMTKTKPFYILLLLIICSLIFSIFGFKNKSSLLPKNSALEEANKSFTFKEKPVHPLLIKEFEIWLSDNCSSVTVSVDLEAAAKARNEYDADNITIENDLIRAKDNDGECYAYEYLGKLNNEIHVLRTFDYGGTAVFQNLFFVKFNTDKAYDENGEIYDRLLMTVVRTFILGDRDNGTIKIERNKVIVSKSKYRDEEVVLSF